MKRRTVLKSSLGLAGLAMSGLAINPAEAASRPSNLKITDIRGCTIASNFDYPIFKIYTNQDIYGLGEVRDGGVLGQALVLKPHLVGRNPLDIDGIMRYLKPMAGEGRMGGGFSGVDMALFDIAGKALGIPAYRILGEKLRNRTAIYADTTASDDPQVFARRMKERQALGYTNFKMDLYMSLISKKPGGVIGGHPTDKGLQYWCEYIEAVRDVIGWDVSLGADHFGRLTVNDAIRMCNAFEKYSLAYVEDLINYDTPDAMALNKKITDAVTVPTLNGEDMFGVEQFRPWIENHAVDIIHPDMETS